MCQAETIAQQLCLTAICSLSWQDHFCLYTSSVSSSLVDQMGMRVKMKGKMVCVSKVLHGEVKSRVPYGRCPVSVPPLASGPFLAFFIDAKHQFFFTVKLTSPKRHPGPSSPWGGGAGWGGVPPRSQKIMNYQLLLPKTNPKS